MLERLLDIFFILYISSKKAKFETIFVRGKECLIHPDAVLLA